MFPNRSHPFIFDELTNPPELEPSCRNPVVDLDNRTLNPKPLPAAKPRVLVLASTFPKGENDNTPRFILDFCKQLSEKAEIFLLTQHRPGTKTRETMDSVRVFRFRYAPEFMESLSEDGGIVSSLKRSPIRWISVPPFIFFQILTIVRLVKKHDIDIVHAHWLIPQGISAAVAKFFLGRDTSVICTGHGADVYAFNSGAMAKLKSWILRSAGFVTVVSSAMANHLRASSPGSNLCPIVIPMGTDIGATFLPADKARNRGTFVFVGRLVGKKGLEFLLKEVPVLNREIGEIKLLIAGDGPEREKLASLAEELDISDQIEFLGSVNRLKVADLYQTCEAAILPFVQDTSGDMEGLGLVTVEAMACRCPVIVGDVPAVHDLVDHGKTGLLCTPMEPGSITSQIKRLRENPDSARNLTIQAEKNVRENFSWDTVSERYAEIYLKAKNTG